MKGQYESYLRFSRPELSLGLNRLLQSLEHKNGIGMFLNNPTGTIAAHFPEVIGKVNIEKVGEANKLVFSIMANDDFRNWAISYSQKLKHNFSISSAKKINKDEIRMDVAKAILKSGDQDIVYALLNEQSRKDGLTTEDMQSKIDSIIAVETVIVLIAVAVIHVAITAMDFNPYAPPTGPDIHVFNKSGGNDIRSIAQQLVKVAKNNKRAGI
ncbi:hypothetical protein [Photorhabdus sp. RM323S]|uniref:hypothetical protein n=1 Tax=Photorhabdus sp. RM323S TaxID=3342828 RepID=UPI0036D9AAB7